MLQLHKAAHDSAPIQINTIDETKLQEWLQNQSSFLQTYLKNSHLTLAAGSVILLPNETGTINSVLFITTASTDPCFFAALPAALPAGLYELADENIPALDLFLLGWALQSYQFAAYKKNGAQAKPVLCVHNQSAFQRAHNIGAAFQTARDLINQPANVLTTTALAAAAERLADTYQARYSAIIGADLLHHNYPAIYAVGQASVQPPHFIELQWGDKNHPKLTLVGKGVVFDTGGLDLKTGGSMTLMKKDMGGAATVLGLAQLIMAENLPVQLRVLIPAVENAVSGNAMRPLDILQTRKGLTVEVCNTDAEGRLILADALFEATQTAPDLIIDFATLTGAARVALGGELPALFGNQKDIVMDIMQCADATHDPMWPLPLYAGYRADLNGKAADLNNIASGGFAGAIYAALFMSEFVGPDTPWIHIDSYAWNQKNRPGRPEGGEALGLRAIFHYLEKRFSTRAA